MLQTHLEPGRQPRLASKPLIRVIRPHINHLIKDTNGNSVTHIMVVYDNMRMFDLAVEGGASINITNNLNMTPLAVAAYLARQDMFFHIANIEREVYWQIGN